MIWRTLLAVLLVIASPAAADSLLPDAEMANVQLSDPAKERQAKALMETIRCLVCQGQSIADSDADMAADMRALIRQRIDKGEAPESIRAWLVERYGSWVSYAPPASTITSPLWVLPIGFFLIGLVLVGGRLKVKRKK
ncbi:MAG: cytochrome c-type biogenesis protein [Pseudomonadota bacterium]